MSFVSSTFSALVHLICGPSQHTSILPHINPNLSLSLESYRFLVWLELFVPFQALVGFSGILYASLFVVLINVVGSCKAFLIKPTTKLQSPLRWKIGKESKETTPTHHEQPSLILHPFFVFTATLSEWLATALKPRLKTQKSKWRRPTRWSVKSLINWSTSIRWVRPGKIQSNETMQRAPWCPTQCCFMSFCVFMPADQSRSH